MEFHHLNEIDARLQILQSDGDFSTISSSCSKSPGQLYQVCYRTEFILWISCLKCMVCDSVCLYLYFLHFSLVSSICSQSIHVKE